MLLRKNPHVGLVLLDLMMPVMDGWKFRAAQQADTAIVDVPVLVLTASGATIGVIGALAILRMPLRMETLLAAVSQYCPPASLRRPQPHQRSRPCQTRRISTTLPFTR